MNLSLRTALLLAASQTPPDPPTVSPPPGDRVSPGARGAGAPPPDAASIRMVGTIGGQEVLLTYSRPEFKPGSLNEKRAWKRSPNQKPQPRFLQTTTTTRAERRARGDYRTVRQIIADFEAKKE